MNHVHLSTCSHPIRIRSVNGFMYVGCGKCDECRHKNRLQWSERIVTEFKASKFPLYFTVTYNNEHLPRVFYKKINDNEYLITGSSSNHIDKIIKDMDVPFKYKLKNEKDFLPHFVLHRSRGSLVFDKSNSFAVADFSDMQKFIKRCRRSLEYHFGDNADSKFRYFICSEYGEETYRPHFHGLIFFNSQDARQYFQEHLLPERWSLCNSQQVRCDTNLSEYACRYVSKYVCKSSDNVGILDLYPFRASHNQSRGPLFGSQQVSLFGKSVHDVTENHSTYIEAYYDSKSSCVVSKVSPFNVSSLLQYFPKLLCRRLLSDAGLRRIFDFLYERRYKRVPNLINNYKRLYKVGSSKEKTWSFVASDCLFQNDIVGYLFGCPQNRRFSNMIINNFLNDPSLVPKDYYCYFVKQEYNNFYNSYVKQLKFMENFDDPLDRFMYTFPTFVEDMSLPLNINDIDMYKFETLECMLFNYGLCVEDLYSEDCGVLKEWKLYNESKEFKDYTTYITDEKKKFKNVRLFNSYKFNVL